MPAVGWWVTRWCWSTSLTSGFVVRGRVARGLVGERVAGHRSEGGGAGAADTAAVGRGGLRAVGALGAVGATGDEGGTVRRGEVRQVHAAGLSGGLDRGGHGCRTPL